ncbi:MAG TPA: deoxyribose-phosphate aldolase [Cyanobacteria bacterium UBA9971]|nr:deoxyribose-phosphate aldolase [Cyanobacteria bacterium UBA9971]
MTNLAKYVDHTLLSSAATKKDVEKLCNEAKEYGFYAVCVQPIQTKNAVEALKGADVKVAAVTGFPHGATYTEIKVEETKKCLADGANEIDMVINVGALKEGNLELVKDEIKKLADLCHGAAAKLKVIIETGLLTDEEKVIACKLSVEAGADCVKTSTGVLKESKPATVEDVKLMYETVKDFGLFVKASGGVSDSKGANALVKAGASRIGTSSGIKIITE